MKKSNAGATVSRSASVKTNLCRRNVNTTLMVQYYLFSNATMTVRLPEHFCLKFFKKSTNFSVMSLS